MNNAKKTHLLSPFVIISAGFGLAFVCIMIASHVFVGNVIIDLIFCIFWPLCILLTIASIIYIAIKYKNNIWGSAIPLLINLVVILTVLGGDNLASSLNIDFYVRRNGYQEVVSLVQANKVPVDQYGIAVLPPKYQYLSDSGSIYVWFSEGITTITFINEAGILGKYSGYVYTSNGLPPSDYCDLWKTLGNQEPKWFYCVSK